MGLAVGVVALGDARLWSFAALLGCIYNSA